MEKLTFQEFLQLPELDISEMGKFFRRKKWLTIGGSNPYRPNYRGWVYDREEKNFFEYRNSKKGKTWACRVLEKPGEFDRLVKEIRVEGFKLNELDEDQYSKNWFGESDSYELQPKKFDNIMGKEVFHFILSMK